MHFKYSYTHAKALIKEKMISKKILYANANLWRLGFNYSLAA